MIYYAALSYDKYSSFSDFTKETWLFDFVITILVKSVSTTFSTSVVAEVIFLTFPEEASQN